MIYLFACWYTNFDGSRMHVDVKAETREEADKKFAVMNLPNLDRQIYCLAIPKGF